MRRLLARTHGSHALGGLCLACGTVMAVILGVGYVVKATDTAGMTLCRSVPNFALGKDVEVCRHMSHDEFHRFRGRIDVGPEYEAHLREELAKEPLKPGETPEAREQAYFDSFSPLVFSDDVLKHPGIRRKIAEWHEQGITIRSCLVKPHMCPSR